MGVDSPAVVIAALVAGLLAGYGIAMPVGAVAAYLVALTARTSLRIGVFAALGIATADGFYALIAVFGGSALGPAIRPIVVPLRWASALVLVVLAVRGTVTAIGRYREHRISTSIDETPVSPARAYTGLLAITLMNPITVVYFAALVLGGQSTIAPGCAERAGFVVAAFAASGSWQLLLAGGGALIGRVLTGRRGQLATAVAASVVIGAIALHLLITGA